MPEPSEQQFPDQDYSGGSTESTSGSPHASGPTGNRPADGAPVMRPDEMSQGDFEGDGSGQDFLGLEGHASNHGQHDGDAEMQQSAYRETASALADAPELEEGEFENWLEDESEDSASWLMELDEEPGEDVFDPERLEAEFGLQSGVTHASRGGWILRLTLVAAGLGAGFVGARWYGDQQLRRGNDTGIAHVQQQNTGRTANSKQANQNKATTENSGTTTNNSANQNAGASPNATVKTGPKGNAKGNAKGPKANGKNAGAQGSQANGAIAMEPVVDQVPGNPGTPTESIPDPAFPVVDSGSTNHREVPITDVTPKTDGASNANSAPNGANGKQPKSGNGKSFTMPVEDMVVIPRVESSVRYATEDDMAAVWDKSEIPLGKISAAERMLTPQVGRVRLVIHSGEVFEGRLYAVGENKVWLETALGKMALLGWQVDRIEHLPENSGVALGAKGSQDLGGLQRVRVRTPGGVFYGKLLDQDDNNVTLITEEGGRLRLANARVEPAGKSRTRIVDPSQSAPTEAASKSSTKGASKPKNAKNN